MRLTFAGALPERGFDVAFDLAEGETVAVLGPNGAGKSTLLGLLAGLLAPSAGRATLGGDVLFDVGPGRRVLIEPRRRGVSLLAQEALLFPHLSVLENVAFGPRSRGLSRAEARATASAWLERVGTPELAGRSPGRLSGGQAQRVAIARALATDPALLLLDEPLAALDVTVAPAIRTLLREVLQGRSAVIVTHDALDAFLLADRVLILDGGRVVEAGRTMEVLTRPVTAFGARLAGLNLLLGRRTETGFTGANGLVVPWEGPGRAGEEFALAIRPAAVSVARPGGPPAGTDHGTDHGAASGTSRVTAMVDDIEHRGEAIRVHAAGMAADLAPADAVAMGILPGCAVEVSLRHQDAVVYALPAAPDAGRGTGRTGDGR